MSRVAEANGPKFVSRSPVTDGGGTLRHQRFSTPESEPIGHINQPGGHRIEEHERSQMIRDFVGVYGLSAFFRAPDMIAAFLSR